METNQKLAIFVAAEVIFTPSDGINEVYIYIFRESAILCARQLKVTCGSQNEKQSFKKHFTISITYLSFVHTNQPNFFDP